MTLRDLGEDRLVASLAARFPATGEVRVGIGDDCAVVELPPDRPWALLKTDIVVEGVHFTAEEDLWRVGWKALCRAISDIAAMGGTPSCALITFAAAPLRKVAEIERLYGGIQKAARRFGVQIVGGETSRTSGPLFCSVALTGFVERERCVLRSGGRAGDALYVTGTLGGSRSGKHLDFIPRLVEARWLTEHFKLRAMMDLSDGLAADLPRLARASRCGFELWSEAVPKTRGCTLEEALQDGEDFELLFALSPRKSSVLEGEWRARFPRLSLTQVGVLTPAGRGPAIRGGFDHFQRGAG